MAGYSNVYSGDGYEARFAGAGGSGRDRDDEYRGARREYETRRMTRDMREQEREDSLNERARETFSSAWDAIRGDATGVAPLTVARDYATHMGKLKVYVDSGQYEKAFGEYSVLREARDNGGDALFAVSTTDPKRTGNRHDADLQIGAQGLETSEFDKLPVTVRQTGETVTAYDLFHDGQAYKKFDMGNALVRNFGADLVTASSSDDEFERRIANRVSEATVGGTEDGFKYRLQFRDLGDYLFKNGEMSKLRDELGDEGTERLVEDALVNGIADGTFRDRMDFVRDVVWQQRQADPTKDQYRLVRDNLDAFNRKVKVMTAKYPGADPASARRFVSKVMTIAAEEAPGAIDFDDERVSERLDRWTGLAARADGLGIPLLVDGHEGGLAVRRAVAESVTPQSLAGEPAETEWLVRLERALDRAGSVLSAGSAPAASVKSPEDSAMTLGFTSGDRSVDRAMRLMAGDLLKHHVLPQMYRGTREDVAIGSLSSDATARDALAGRWGDAISVSLGLSPATGAYLASSLVGKAFRDGGTVPVSLRAEIMSASFARDVPPDVARELRRYVKARDLVDDSALDGLLTGYRVMLADPLVGHGFSKRDLIEAHVADMKNRMAAVMENGGDPSVVAKAAAGTGYPLLWTGEWVLADGSVVSDREYRDGKRTVDGREEKVNVKDAIPRIGKSRSPVDLDTHPVEVPAYGGRGAETLPAGSWAGNEDGYRGFMTYMQRLADLALRRQQKQSDAAGRSSGGDGISRL